MWKRGHFTSLWSTITLPLWSSGQSNWLQTQRSWVRFPALPDFMSSSGSGIGSTQPQEYKWGATWNSSGSSLETQEDGRRDPLHWHPMTSGGHLVGIVRSRTETTGFVCYGAPFGKNSEWLELDWYSLLPVRSSSFVSLLYFCQVPFHEIYETSIWN
jgi:hypothetical protein